MLIVDSYLFHIIIYYKNIWINMLLNWRIINQSQSSKRWSRCQAGGVVVVRVLLRRSLPEVGVTGLGISSRHQIWLGDGASWILELESVLDALVW